MATECGQKNRKLQNFQKLYREPNLEPPYCGAVLTAVFPELSKDCGAFNSKVNESKKAARSFETSKIATATLHTSISYTAVKALKTAYHFLLSTFGDIPYYEAIINHRQHN